LKQGSCPQPSIGKQAPRSQEKQPGQLASKEHSSQPDKRWQLPVELQVSQVRQSVSCWQTRQPATWMQAPASQRSQA
jgi:hypothetical protein